MESEHIKGASTKVAGEATDNTSLELKDKAQQVKGEVQKGIGDAKDAV